MSFQQGLSGLNTSSKNLDVIGNNIANASTVGFKASQAQFSDMFTASLSGTGTNAIGSGAKLATVAQQFTQGNVSTTNNPLDVAISGNGLFQMTDADGNVSYTRNGQFQMDKNGYIVGNTRLFLNGIPRPAGGSPQPIQIDTAGEPAIATTKIAITANLKAGSTPPTGVFPSPLLPTVPATVPPTYVQPDTTMYNNSTSLTIYDSVGGSHVASLYFGATATAGEWDVNMIIDGGQYNSGTVLSLGPMVFDGTGHLTSPAGPPVGVVPGVDPTWDAFGTNGVNWDPVQLLDMDFSKLTQYGNPFSPTTLTQDGNAAGQLTKLNIDAKGMISGVYTNGKSRDLYQLSLVTFPNNQGLTPIGNNQWIESPESGSPVPGTPGAGGKGVLQSGSVEDSTTDLTQELVNMITAQRVYQANAQTIKTQDQVMQTLVNLR